MIFHISISADDPKRTATMLAELWRGEAFYFPMVGKGSWVVHAGDDRRSTFEVFPRGRARWRRPASDHRSLSAAPGALPKSGWTRRPAQRGRVPARALPRGRRHAAR